MKKRAVFLALALGAFMAIGTGFYVYYTNILNTETIYKGVKVAGYDLSDKTKKQAIDYVEENKESDIDKKSMKLYYKDKSYNISLRDLGFSYKYEDAINRAYDIGRKGNMFSRIKNVRNIRKDGIDIPLESFYDMKKIEDIVNNISQEIDLESKDAEINLNNGNINIKNEVMGKVVIKDKLAHDIAENVYDLEDIQIPIEEKTPKITKAILSRINGIIGEYSTSYSTSSSDRIENIRLSSKAISGKLILPGEEFSYNNTTGPRERKNGYKEANVIIGGELTPGVGGGVCQTSTTLYNALLLADIETQERHPHSIPASYVKYGQDAAVAYGYLDLKFINKFDYPIYIYSKMSGGRVHIYIYGDKSRKDYSVKIDSDIVETIPLKVEEVFDNKVTPGTKELIQKGRPGYRVKTYKSIMKNGKVVSKTLINNDYYKPKKTIYRVGPALPKVQETINNNKDKVEGTQIIEDTEAIEDTDN